MMYVICPLHKHLPNFRENQVPNWTVHFLNIVSSLCTINLDEFLLVQIDLLPCSSSCSSCRLIFSYFPLSPRNSEGFSICHTARSLSAGELDQRNLTQTQWKSMPLYKPGCNLSLLWLAAPNFPLQQFGKNKQGFKDQNKKMFQFFKIQSHLINNQQKRIAAEWIWMKYDFL